ncbi:MAG: DUF5667 domain-containing protein [Candidatus Peregrinibacteria bacterium]
MMDKLSTNSPMYHLEVELRRLKKVSPSDRFCQQARGRLLHQIELRRNETWFQAFVRRLGAVLPRAEFLAQARVRLMEHIAVRPSVGWGLFFRRFAASALVLILAVSSTLFFVDGRQMVSASEDTYIEVLAGDVRIKHADQLVWRPINSVADVFAGDLIEVDEAGLAIVHFFDDTQIRLNEKTLLLVDQIESSPVFARQGILSISLQQGQVWVQTLNVNDDFASFTLSTRDAVVRALNSSFDLKSALYQPTQVRVFNNSLSVDQFHSGTGAVVQSVTLEANQKADVTAAPIGQSTGPFAVRSLADADRAETWVSNNLSQDREHLVLLREREFAALREAAGVLPGQFLYPVKLVKERLKLAFSFGDQNVTQAQIDIANKRLNEAMVLLEQGEQGKALEALMAYQSLMRGMVETAEAGAVKDTISYGVIAKNQKAFVAALPTDSPVRLVKEALNKTEELIAKNPLDREQVRLKNSIERLTHINDLIVSGEFESAKTALAEYRLNSATVLDETVDLSDTQSQREAFEQVLTLRQTEAGMLAAITALMADQQYKDTQLMAMLEQATDAADAAVSDTIAFIAPLVPELVYEVRRELLVDENVQEFVDRLLVYKTWDAQKNQLSRLIKEQPQYRYNIDFLTQVRAQVTGRTVDLIDTYILGAKSQERLRTHKIVKQKIDRAKRMRQGEE